MGHTGTAENLWYSNVIKKFGAGSELFNGYAWIYTDNDPTFSPGSENFTFSVWVYPTSTLSGRGLVWGNWWPNQEGTCLDFLSGVPRFVYDNSGTTKIISGTTAPPVNPWTNIVLQGKNVGESSDITLYVNGIPNGTIDRSYNIRKAPSQSRFYIGRTSTEFYLLQDGTYIDDFFAVKGGPARNTGSIDTPVKEFGFIDKFQEFSRSGILVNKSANPRSIKLGKETRITINIENSQQTPIYDIEVSDRISPDFQVTQGKTQYSAKILQPGESLILDYTIKSTKVGTFTLNSTSVLLADQYGDYHLIQSEPPMIRVLESLINPSTQISPGSGTFDSGYLLFGGIILFLQIIGIYIHNKTRK